MRFIRLSTVLINPTSIQTIRIYPNKYYINLHMEVSGWMIAGSGGFSSFRHRIEVCKKENEADYDVVTKWLQSGYKVNECA